MFGAHFCRNAVLLFVCVFAFATQAAEQLVVSIAPKWDSTQGTLQRYERDGTAWKAVGITAR